MHASRLVTAVVATTLAASALTACDSASNTAASCPTGSPGTSTAPDWTLEGGQGSIEVTGPTDSAAPVVRVKPPFSVQETQVKAFPSDGEAEGEVVPENATVSVCYLGVNGRTGGDPFDSTYNRGKPTEFPLDGVIPGFKKAIAGQKVGSSVGVAIAPADGYPTGQPSAGIEPGDTLIFAIKILAVKK
ncbi:FKBP-type peptidyl-prolyl cis-trans isomerase [Tsukamurella sp. 1534]|uniref:FKBP-type peptidyl-prolyl cis-trans isomerase n=1 Tax=Tsukamurella sp. 1534 TaxID=1151061 RepID=UPI000310E689|nr:FKBP-type peptidyl-prolyl cis-trans isomerase [Tsukamurella sp. 1534]